MSESGELTTLSDAQYLQAPEYQAHVQEMLASYDHPTGILRELISQMADAFWWIRIYRAEKNHLVVSEMTDCLINKNGFGLEPEKEWGQMQEILTKVASGESLTADEQNALEAALAKKGYSLQSLRTDVFRLKQQTFDTIDRLIERQLKNVKLLVQTYDSVQFAPQVLKKMALEIEQLELQVKRSREDQHLEVARQ